MTKQVKNLKAGDNVKLAVCYHHGETWTVLSVKYRNPSDWAAVRLTSEEYDSVTVLLDCGQEVEVLAA